MEFKSKIYVAGHRGLVGSAITKKLRSYGFRNIVTRTHRELDLTIFEDVKNFFEHEKPDYVFLAAAKVGGILANYNFPADFLYANAMIEANVIYNACKNKVKKLLFLGSACIYPKFSPQPIKEEYLFTGKLEQTNEAYAIAKIMGIKLCEYYRKQYDCDFISAMPTNLYGVNDNFDLKNSHVLPALIRKFYEAKKNNDKEVILWGTGNPTREFLYSDDLADACLYLMRNYSSDEPINVGTGKTIRLIDLASMVQNIANYKGEIKLDLNKPDGTPERRLDVSKLENLGWKYKVDLEKGIEIVYNWYEKKGHYKWTKY